MHEASLCLRVQGLQSQVTRGDALAAETTLVVQSLDQRSRAAVGDLRGRVARYAPPPPLTTSQQHRGVEPNRSVVF